MSIANSDPLMSTQELANPAEDTTMPDQMIPQDEEKPTEEEEEKGVSGYPLEIEKALIDCYNFYRLEERGTRDVMIAFWKKLENYWQGIQRIFWDYSLNDWRRTPEDGEDEAISSLVDPTLYDKVINIYRAHGESIIAALSVKTPSVIFYPDDADVNEDVDTARAYQKIAQLITRHNGDTLLIMKALFILFNQGVVASYIYNRESSEYGTVRVPQYGDDITHITHTLICPICNEFIDEFSTRGDEQVPVQLENCNSCGNQVEPIDNQTQEIIPQITGYSAEAKSRTIVDVFGPLYAHMPFYARKQDNIPYIHFNFEQHNAMLRDFYPDLIDKILIKGGGSKSWDRWSRSYNVNNFADSQDLSTVTLQWLRPWAFQCLGDIELAERLKKEFPDGVHCAIINGDIIAEARPENMDDHWEISVNPLSNFLHADPLGKPLAPVQEIQTEINDLKLETFEHSIPETFADPKVLDFKKYKEMDARPGQMVPAKAPQGKGLSEAFHTVKPATLSDEISKYDADMTSKGQFVTGAFPSIFGGANTTGSKTASEYSDSRAMALQRLSLTWKIVKAWWAKSIGKATTLYANSLVIDEKFVQKSKTSPSGFENIFIKLAELTGQIGRVEADTDEDIPINNEQIKDLFVQLFTLNNEQINEALMDPMNAPLLVRALGNPDFYIQGQGDRDKQQGEIGEILKGMPVEVDPLIDNHGIHIEVLKAWLVSSSGVALKKINIQGYQMLEMHLQEHIQLFAQMQPPVEDSGKEAPIPAEKDKENVSA
jgi:hypothetical protein